MGELVLLHCDGGIKYLSFLSRPHMSPKENISLPFCEDEDEISGNSCRGLFYFDNFEGKTVVCNLTTKEFKLLTPPSSKAFYCNSGLGYDPESDDYKVIINHEPGCTAEVYSLKSDSWKVILGPGDDFQLTPECGVYLDGSCYWIVCVYVPEAVESHDFILSFNFTTETFSRLPLPLPLYPRGDCRVGLFDCDGFLGVVGFTKEYDYKTRVAKHLELWVCREGSWARSFGGVLLLDVERPLGLKDGRFLFLEGNSSCKHNHLMVYDWVKEELREHDIYDVPPSEMLLLSYVENTVVLPDAKPLINGVLQTINCNARNVEDSSANVFKRCRCREKVPKRIGHSAQDAEQALKKCSRREKATSSPASQQSDAEQVLKRCSRRREKATSSPASQQS